MSGRNHQEADSGQEDEEYDFSFRFQKIFACYVLPCLHSACILYIMAAATMRVSTSIYTIAIMVFVVCDLLAWAVTTLGFLLCAPSFFETLLQEGITKKFYVWKGISMVFEVLILLMLILVEVIKKKHVIDCMGVCGVVFLFSGVLGIIFIIDFQRTLEKIKVRMEEKREKTAIHGVPSVSYQGNASQIDTDITSPSVPDFIEFDNPPSNPTAPFAAPSSKTRRPKSKTPYKNEPLKNAKTANKKNHLAPTTPFENPRSSPARNESPPDHPLEAPSSPFSNFVGDSPPKANAPLYAQSGKEARRVPSNSRSPFVPNNRSPNFSTEFNSYQQPLSNWHSNNSTDAHYPSSGVSDQAPPPMLAFTPPKSDFRVPFDDESNNFTGERSYNNPRM